MKKRYIIFFIIFFSLISALLHLLFGWQHRQLISYFHQETKILHYSIAERFNLLMDSHRAIGIVSSEYLSSGRMESKEYNELVSNILQNFDEILGLNILDQNGVIVRVAPESRNRLALGKKTQNFEALLESSQKRELFWLSPPFKLFQGEQGFAFYMPFYNNGKLMGWIAPVISQKTFFNKFVKSEFLATYHFVIKDESTGLPYFSTAFIPEKRFDIFENTIEIWGRKITFISWPIEQQILGRNQLLINLLISFVVAALGAFSFWQIDQKGQTRRRLESLKSLLRLTVQDTKNSLLSIHNQLNQVKLGTSQAQLERVTKHVGYISTLLRQIEVLQQLSGKIDPKEFEKTPILPMILEISELLNDTLNEKKIVFDYDPQEMARIEVMADKWLLCHSVFAHFIRQAIRLSPPESDVQFKHFRENNYRCFTIQHTGQNFSDDLIQGKISEEADFVAEKVVHLHNGKLIFTNTLKGGMVTIKLPIPK